MLNYLLHVLNESVRALVMRYWTLLIAFVRKKYCDKFIT